MSVCVTLKGRLILLDTRMNTVLAPAVLTILEKSKNVEQAYHDRENLHWDRDVTVEVS